MSRKSGVLLSYILMIFEVLSTLLLTPFIIKSFGQAEYGIYKLTASVSAYLLLLDMGVGNAVVRYIAKYHVNGEYEQERRFFGVAQIYYLGVAAVAGVCGAILVLLFPEIFSKGLNEEEIRLSQILLGILSVNVVVTLATSPFNHIIIGLGHFTMSRGLSIAQIVIRLMLSFFALSMGYKSVAIVSINLITTVICRAGYGVYIFFRIKIKPLLRGIDREFVKDVVRYSTWILLQMIATQVNAFADQVLIGILVPGAAGVIAVYGVGAQISQYYQSIGSAFTGVLMPGVVRLVERGADGKALQTEMIKIGRIVLWALIAVFGGFLLYGKQFIQLWAGQDYAEGYYVALILMCAHMFILAEAIGNQILWAKNEHKEQAILKLVIVVANIVWTVVLIRWEPLIGATVGTFISLILGDVLVMNIVFAKKIGIRLREYYEGLLKGIAGVFAVSVIVNYPVYLIGLSGWLGFGINIAIYCIVFFAFALMFGLNEYERNLIFGVMPFVKGLFKKTR